MGIPISICAVPYQTDDLLSNLRKKTRVHMKTRQADGHSPFDKLLLYPIFSSARRRHKEILKGKPTLMTPITMYNRVPDKEPLVIVQLDKVLRNLDSGGELEKNSTVLSSLLIAQYEDMDYEVTVNYAYGFSSTTGKCYFYRSGNFEHLMSKVDKCEAEDLRNANVSSRQIFLTHLHQLINTMTGTVWLNGYSMTGPEDPKERIPVDTVNVRSIPARVTISVRDLDGIHVIRTKTRLEIYGKMCDENVKKGIWFRGPFANSLIVTEVEEDLMSILIPAYCQHHFCSQIN